MKSDTFKNRAVPVIRRTALIIAAVFMAAAMLCACSREPENTTVVYKTIVCEGLTKSYRLVFIADLHLTVDGDTTVTPENRGIADLRHLAFAKDGQSAEEYWRQLSKELNRLKPDAVIMGGDMIDFCTPAAVSSLQKGLSRIKAPVLYVRADHDYATWYSEGLETEEDVMALHDGLIDNSAVISLDLGELKIVGINNTTSQISGSARDQVLAELGAGSSEKEPAIVISHVPFKPESDDAFALTSEEAWGGRRLYWGKDGEYYPDANTRDVMDYLYSDESPVKAVLCGHLHFAYEGPLTSDQSGTMQYVTAPAFLHYITVFTVTGSSGHSN